ncbi:unnamed protein product [Strongylus vulgaris]|uniref:DDE Tnp4 domain-containing protein n=1 Tax=Strongylus vulgaris TaxID=40348 RepID=A0A3P7IE75_STRVU|nr:unnamed protein product [Strongylus vulgaris]
MLVLFAEASPPLTKDTIVLVLRVLWTRSMLELKSPEMPLYVIVFMAFDIGTPERAGDAEVTFLEERDELFLKSYARHALLSRYYRARRMIESSFGILCKRFVILQRDLQVEPEKASKIVASLLARKQDLLEQVQRFAPPRNSALPDRFAPLQRIAGGGGTDSAKIARDRLVQYYDNL